jgi:hypothetical protein
MMIEGEDLTSYNYATQCSYTTCAGRARTNYRPQHCKLDAGVRETDRQEWVTAVDASA